jgi:ribosomal protein L31
MENSLYNDLKKSIKFIFKNRITYLLFLLIFIFTIITLIINNKIILKKVYIEIKIEKYPFYITKNTKPVNDFENKYFERALNEAFFITNAGEIIYLVDKNFKKLLEYNVSSSRHYINFLTEINFTEGNLEKFLEKYNSLYNDHNTYYIYKLNDLNKNKLKTKYTPIKFQKDEVFYKIDYHFDFKSILLIFIFFSFIPTVICIIKEIYNENNR